ncbi:MAG: hypothetical protein QOI77_118 [Blastocatellia bacterium]|jgi:hypothetical protein|nr:hypothetical protein [Blastocatellia bacterium]
MKRTTLLSVALATHLIGLAASSQALVPVSATATAAAGLPGRKL